MANLVLRCWLSGGKFLRLVLRNKGASRIVVVVQHADGSIGVDIQAAPNHRERREQQDAPLTTYEIGQLLIC